MKPLLAFVVFILAIGLSFKTIAAAGATPEVCTSEKTENCSQPEVHANKSEHAAEKSTPAHGEGHETGEHHGLATKMNSLFPPKEKSTANVITPSVAKLTSPKFLAQVSGTSAKLEWTAGANATTYHVQVATDPNFKWLVANELNVTGTTYTANNLEAGKRYYWRVASVKADNESMYTKSLFVSSAFDVK